MSETYIRRNGAVINTDQEGLAAYRLRKSKMREDESRLRALEEKMGRIADDLSLIKELLTRGR